MKKRIKKEWDRIAKPLNSMGKFEDYIAQIGQIQNTMVPRLDKSALLVFCADNGIVEEGISQSSQEVTRICAENIAAYKSVVGILCQKMHCDCKVYDVGIAYDQALSNVMDCKIQKGTNNFLQREAMKQEDVEACIQLGKTIVKTCKQEGYTILCVGEMGIGNTTTSSAVAASLLQVEPKLVTGRGAGLDTASLCKKVSVIEQAIEKYNLYHQDVYTILRSVGGFDIACMVGVYLGAYEESVPVILDGAISLVAALAASKINPNVMDVCIPSHKSKEPLCTFVCETLEIDPVIDGQMALGEGSGALLMLELLQTAFDVYKKALRFETSGVEQYEHFEENV